MVFFEWLECGGVGRTIRISVFVTALVLVVSGLLSAISGLTADREQPFIIGVVLIFASGVFATLFLGIRSRID